MAKREFKMVCFSRKCCGDYVQAKGKTKFENKFQRDCPDCGHALVQDYSTPQKPGNGKKVKDQAKVYRPDAELGFKTRNRYEQDL